MIAPSVLEKKNPWKQQRWAKISGPFTDFNRLRSSGVQEVGLGIFFLIENEAP